MSVRIRTLLIVGGVLLSLVAALILTAQFILIDGFEKLEHQAVQDNTERVSNAIVDEIGRMLSTTADWSYWDDTYQFIEDSNQDYIDANLAPETLGNLGLNMMIFINNTGEIVFSRVIDLETYEELPLPDLGGYLQPDSAFITRENDNSAYGAIITLPDYPMMLTSRAILTSELAGPSRGTLILGRSLDAAWGQSIADSLKLDLSFLPATGESGSDVQHILAQLSPDTPAFIQAVNDNTIAGYGLVADPQGVPVLLFQVNMARDILAQGRTTFTFFALSLLGIAVVGGILTVLILDRAVLSRLGRLRDDVDRISVSGDLSYRVQDTGNDELAVLGSKLNEMLDALRTSQQSQRESAERLQTLVHNAPVLLWSVDVAGILTYLDGSELQSLAIQPEKIIGKPASEWSRILPVREDEFRTVMNGSTTTTTASRAALTFAVHCVPIRDNGNIRGAIGIATNISEQVSAEEGLQQANQTLEQKNRQLQRAHEILRSTVETLGDLIQRGASSQELADELALVQREFQQM